MGDTGNAKRWQRVREAYATVNRCCAGRSVCAAACNVRQSYVTVIMGQSQQNGRQTRSYSRNIMLAQRKIEVCLIQYDFPAHRSHATIISRA